MKAETKDGEQKNKGRMKNEEGGGRSYLEDFLC
jgi:hypothetical protein